MELFPKIGIDNIRFGLTQTEVLSLLGHPDKTFADPDEENEIFCQYNQYKLTLTFYLSENNRLGYIRCANPEITFNGNKILNLLVKKIQREVFPKLSQTWEIEYYDFFDTYFTEDYWLTLNVEYGEITDLEIGVPINSDDMYDWPS